MKDRRLARTVFALDAILFRYAAPASADAADGAGSPRWRTLNVFFGVRNLNEGFLPAHLKYLQTYFTRKGMNQLFPVSFALATMVAIPVWRAVFAPGASAFDMASLALLGSLLGLAILEHWFLVLPLPSKALWKWGLRSREAGTLQGVDASLVPRIRPSGSAD